VCVCLCVVCVCVCVCGVCVCVFVCGVCVCVCVCGAHRTNSLRVYRNDLYQYCLETSLMSTFVSSHTDVKQGRKNRRRNSARTTKFFLKALDICGPNLEVIYYQICST